MTKKVNIIFFDIDGVLLPIKWYWTDWDIPLHISDFIKELKLDSMNKIVISSSWASDDFDLFKLLNRNNLKIDWKINGDIELSWDRYKEKYIAEFIYRNVSLNSLSIENIIIIDDELINLENIISHIKILEQKYDKEINIKQINFTIVKTNPDKWIMWKEIVLIKKLLSWYIETDFSSIKWKIKDIKKNEKGNSLMLFPENWYEEEVLHFFKWIYNRKRKFEENYWKEEDSFDYTWYEEPSLVKYKFLWNDYDCITLWFDNEDYLTDESKRFYSNKLL